MRSGTVMKTCFDVYEGHLSFTLQFMCDFGLYGCGWLDLAEIYTRGFELTTDEGGGQMHTPLPDGSQFGASPLFRQSRMSLEFDVISHQILNRRHLSARNIHHELRIPGPPLPSEPLIDSVRELWEDERRRRASHGLNPSPEIPIDPSEDSRGKGGGWVSEARWWDEIRARIQRDRTEPPAPKEDASWQKWVMTTFESTEALWDSPWKTWRPIRDQETTAATRVDTDAENPFERATSSEPSEREDMSGQDDAEVDEKLLSSQVQIMDIAEANWPELREHDGLEDGLVLEEEATAEPFFEDEEALEVPEDSPPPDMQSQDEYQPRTNSRPIDTTWVLIPISVLCRP